LHGRESAVYGALYRIRKAPLLSGPFDFSKPEDRARLTELTAPLTNEVKTKNGAAYMDANCLVVDRCRLIPTKNALAFVVDVTILYVIWSCLPIP
jgi:hypothetical protein